MKKVVTGLVMAVVALMARADEPTYLTLPLQWSASDESAAVRVDLRDTFGGTLVTGREAVGTTDGSTVTTWDTTDTANGWTTKTDNGTSKNLYVLNNEKITVEDGRLTASAVWTSDTTHVIRHDVVVPSGVTLTIVTNAVVKFCPGTCIKVEDGGRLDLVGAKDGVVVLSRIEDDAHGEVIAGSGVTDSASRGIVLQSSAATFTDNSYFYTEGFTFANLPTVSVESATVSRLDGKANVQFTLAGATRNQAFSVDYEVTDITAVHGADYSGATRGTVTWAKSADGRKTVSIPLNQDITRGEERTFRVRITAAYGANIGAREAVIKIVELVVLPLEWGESAESAAVRVDLRDTLGGQMVTGTETVGTTDGASARAWDTTQEANGWATVTDDVSGTNVVRELFVVNNAGVSVEGGRVAASTNWTDAVTHVIRHTVVVPSGVTLTVTTNAVVKFCPGTRIRVEDGGALKIVGADGADVILTRVNDDRYGVALADTRLVGEWEPGYAPIDLQSTSAGYSDNGFFQMKNFGNAKFPTVTLKDSTAFRSDGTAYVRFEVTGTTREAPFSVDWVAKDGSAKFGEDYTLAAGRVSWNKSSEGVKMVQIPLVTNRLRGAVTDFSVNITTARCCNVSVWTNTVTIREATFTDIASAAAESAPVRFDTRATFGGTLVTQVAPIGTADGSAVRDWNTYAETNGWHTLTDGGVATNLYVLNDRAVTIHDGRLAASVTWPSNTTHLIRHTVVVPSGVTLTIGAGAVVKFSPETEIFVEDGGTLNVLGSEGARAVFTGVNDDAAGREIVGHGVEPALRIGAVRLQSSAAKFTDTGYLRVNNINAVGTFPTVSIHGAATDRANGAVWLALTLSGASRDKRFDVDWVAKDGTAKFGEDYTLQSGAVVWNKTNEGTKWIQIPLVATPKKGARRTFTVELTGGNCVNLAEKIAEVEIQELDAVTLDLDSVRIYTNCVDSAAFSVDALAQKRPLFAGDTAELRYSAAWASGTNAVALAGTRRSVITLENEAMGTESLLEGAAGETGRVELDVAALNPGGYLLTHTVVDAEGQAVPGGTATKRFTVMGTEGVVMHGGTITSNETWKADVVHIVFEQVEVPALYTIFLEPGAVVKFFTGTGINVQPGGGALFADGIIFTHINDDTVGGDTMYDGFAEPPVPDGYTLTGNLTIGEDSEMRYMKQPPLSGTISASRTLSRGAIYEVTGNLTLASGATLTIPAGVVIKFHDGVTFTVNKGATLKANGTRISPVVFTSIKDDEHGGDTNGDGDKTRPQMGDWQSIAIAGGVADFNGTFIYYGCKVQKGAIYFDNNANVTFKNGGIYESKFDAIGGESGTFRIENSVVSGAACAFRHWAQDAVNCVFWGCGKITQGGGQKFTNCVFMDIDTQWEDFGWRSTFNNCVFWNSDKNPQRGSLNAIDKAGTNGNIWGDPKFVDPDNGDFRIQAGSACIDAADGSVAPEFDYYGTKRWTIDAAAGAGTVAANGMLPDVGISEFLTRGAPSDIDLKAVSVECQAKKVKPGELVFVSWVIENLGSENAGAFANEISLVSSTGAATLLGRSAYDKGIAPGGTANCGDFFTVPPLAEGDYTLRLTVNANRDVYEGESYGNNAVTAEGTVAVEHAMFNTDMALSGYLVAGESAFLTLDADADNDRIAYIDIPEGATVFYGIGFIPRNGCASGKLVSSGCFRVPAGDKPVYVVIDSSNGGEWQIDFEEASLAVSDVLPRQLPESGTATLRINGAGFSDKATIALTSGTEEVLIENTRVVSAEEILATVDCATLTKNVSYAVKIADGDKSMISRGIDVTGGKPYRNLVHKLVIPESMRQGREYVGYIEYENAGNVDEPLPIFIVNGRNMEVGLEEKNIPWTSQLAVIGSGDGTGNPLSPGKKYQLRFLCKPTASADIKIACHILNEDKAIDKERIYKKEGVETGDAVLKEKVDALYGDTWGDFARNIRDFLKGHPSVLLYGADMQYIIERCRLFYEDENKNIVYGIVKDAYTGKRVEGCVVMACSCDTANDIEIIDINNTDESGRYCLRNLSNGGYRINLSWNGWSSSYDIDLGDRVETRHDFIIESKCATLKKIKIYGRVVDEESNPVVDAIVQNVVSVDEKSYTDSNGYYECFVMADSQVLIEVNKSHFCQERRSFSVDDRDKEVPLIQLNSGEQINKIAMDSNGIVITNAFVYVMNEDRSVVHVLNTDNLGNYVCVLKPGEYKVCSIDGTVIDNIISGKSQLKAMYMMQSKSNDTEHGDAYYAIQEAIGIEVACAMSAWGFAIGGQSQCGGFLLRAIGPLGHNGGYKPAPWRIEEDSAMSWFAKKYDSYTGLTNSIIVAISNALANSSCPSGSCDQTLVFAYGTSGNPDWKLMTPLGLAFGGTRRPSAYSYDVKSEKIIQENEDEKLVQYSLGLHIVAPDIYDFHFSFPFDSKGLQDIGWLTPFETYLEIGDDAELTVAIKKIKYPCQCPEDATCCSKECESCTCGGTGVGIPQSVDPNEMGGPMGLGDEETERFVKPGEWMDYTIYFENQTNATAAAQEVKVTLDLDPQLDWNTFELGEVVFNNQTDTGLVGKRDGESVVTMNGTNLQVRTTVTVDNGRVRWYQRIVDPTTADGWPTDVYAGFLPPNDPETHCGEGHLCYRVKVRDDAKKAEKIRADADIVFDYNPAIRTDPAWWNFIGHAPVYITYARNAEDDLVLDFPSDGWYPFDTGAFAKPSRIGYLFEGWETADGTKYWSMDDVGYDVTHLDFTATWRFEVTNEFTTVAYGQGVEITSIVGECPADLIIPAVVLGEGGARQRVIGVGESAFRNQRDMVSLEIRDGVERIEVLAFYGCAKLARVLIPASVTYIGQNAFFGCRALAEVEFESATPPRFMNATFMGATGRIIVPEGAADAYRALVGTVFPSGWTVEERVETYPEPVWSLGSDGRLRYAAGAKRIIWNFAVKEGKHRELTILSRIDTGNGIADLPLPESVTDDRGNVYTIVDIASTGGWKGSALYGAEMTSLVIPSTVTNLPAFAFADCYNLARVEFAAGSELTTLPEGLFYSCCALEEVVFAEDSQIETIGTDDDAIGVFEECWELKGIDLPLSVVDIRSHAFENCPALAWVDFNAAGDSALTNIAARAFYNCDTLGEVDFAAMKNLVAIGEEAFAGELDAYAAPLGEIVFHNPVQVGAGAISSRRLNQIYAYPPEQPVLAEGAFDRYGASGYLTVCKGMENVYANAATGWFGEGKMLEPWNGMTGWQLRTVWSERTPAARTLRFAAVYPVSKDNGGDGAETITLVNSSTMETVPLDGVRIVATNLEGVVTMDTTLSGLPPLAPGAELKLARSDWWPNSLLANGRFGMNLYDAEGALVQTAELDATPWAATRNGLAELAAIDPRPRELFADDWFASVLPMETGEEVELTSDMIDAGLPVTMTAADYGEGWSFSHWSCSVTNFNGKTENPLSFTMPATNFTLKAFYIWTPVITNLTARQHVPWDGLVDVAFEVTSATNRPVNVVGDSRYASLALTADGTSNLVESFSFVDFDGSVSSNGVYLMTATVDTNLTEIVRGVEVKVTLSSCQPGLIQTVYTGRSGASYPYSEAYLGAIRSEERVLSPLFAYEPVRYNPTVYNEVTGNTIAFAAYGIVHYEGEIFLKGNVDYRFFGNVDDHVTLCIGDAVVLNRVTFGSSTVALKRVERDGWYPFELWFDDNGGGEFGASSSGTGMSAFGFGWNTNGTTRAYNNPDSWSKLRDDGMGTLLRCRPVGTDDSDVSASVWMTINPFASALDPVVEYTDEKGAFKSVTVERTWLTENAARTTYLNALTGLDMETDAADAIADRLTLTGANGVPLWHSFVAGLEPDNADSVLRAFIALTNGVPYITWNPDLGERRVYTIEGKQELRDSKWISPTNSLHRFFRVTVEMP